MASVRKATTLDSDQIREIHLLAFPESERTIVSALAIDLLHAETKPETLSFVAVENRQLAGHVSFSPLTITGRNNCRGYILAPLAVRPQFQGQKIGASLVRHGINLITHMGVDTLLVYGDPNYYGRFGFDAESAANFTPPYPLQYPHGWLGLNLTSTPLAESSVTITCTAPLMNPQLW